MAPKRTRQIHDIDDEDYRKFASLARMYGLTLADYLGVLARRDWDAMVAREGKEEVLDAPQAEP